MRDKVLAARSRLDPTKNRTVTWDLPADISTYKVRYDMVPYISIPNNGDPVHVPYPLPDWWLQRSKEALEFCQQNAILLTQRLDDDTDCTESSDGTYEYI